MAEQLPNAKINFYFYLRVETLAIYLFLEKNNPLESDLDSSAVVYILKSIF